MFYDVFDTKDASKPPRCPKGMLVYSRTIQDDRGISFTEGTKWETSWKVHSRDLQAAREMRSGRL